MRNSKKKTNAEEPIDLKALKNEESDWRKNLPCYTSKELFEIFPEAKEIVPKKIEELRELRNKIHKLAKQKLEIVKRSKHPWFWKIWIAVNEGEKLVDLDRKIKRLRFELLAAKGETPKSPRSVTPEDIEMAVRADIVGILHSAGVKLQKYGNRWRGLCPFHKESNPSFYAYTETNSFYCFGCAKSGNAITLIQELHGFSFVEAVKFLSKYA